MRFNGKLREARRCLTPLEWRPPAPEGYRWRDGGRAMQGNAFSLGKKIRRKSRLRDLRSVFDAFAAHARRARMAPAPGDAGRRDREGPQGGVAAEDGT
jgi:hypothetical protein